MKPVNVKPAVMSDFRSHIDALSWWLACTIVAFAVTFNAHAATSADDDSDTPGSIIKASDLIGKNVKNQAGENLGEIKDVAIDWDKRRIAYAVLSTGGILNIGNKLS